VSCSITAVPLPSTLWLLGAAGLGGLAAHRRVGLQQAVFEVTVLELTISVSLNRLSAP